MHFTRAMFMEIDRAGVFGDDRVELIEGELFIMAPSGESYRSVRRVAELTSVKSTAVPGLVLDLTNIFVKR